MQKLTRRLVMSSRTLMLLWTRLPGRSGGCFVAGRSGKTIRRRNLLLNLLPSLLPSLRGKGMIAVQKPTRKSVMSLRTLMLLWMKPLGKSGGCSVAGRNGKAIRRRISQLKKSPSQRPRGMIVVVKLIRKSVMNSRTLMLRWTRPLVRLVECSEAGKSVKQIKPSPFPNQLLSLNLRSMPITVVLKPTRRSVMSSRTLMLRWTKPLVRLGECSGVGKSGKLARKNRSPNPN